MGFRWQWSILLTLHVLASWAAPALAESEAKKCCGYTVTGYVWHDLNGNGIDESEPRLAGWTLQAYNSTSGFLAATAISDANGDFTFSTPVGCAGIDAVFALVLQPGYTQTYPTAPTTYTLFNMGGCGGLFDELNFGVVGMPCDPHTETWTLDGEFATGDLNGVQTVSDNLELTPTPTTLGYGWVANTGEGTVSRIDLATGNEVGRYYTGPPNGSGSYTELAPSRTAVDRDGNCWVLNRHFSGAASLTQILATGGIDRNASTTIETSQDNVLIDGQIDASEILPWGADERVARHYVVGGTMPDNIGRALTIDKMGFLWVGLFNSERVVKLDPDLSTVTYAPDLTPVAPPELASVVTAPYRPYGLALSPSGLIYGATLDYFSFELDPGLASGGTAAGPAVTQYIDHQSSSFTTNYGIAVDQDCVVWLTASQLSSTDFGCIRWDPSVGVGVPSAGWSFSQPGASGYGRGITVDYDGNVWMTINEYIPGVTTNLAKYLPTDPPTFVAEYATGLGTPVGVGVGDDENIIVTDSGTSSAWVKVNKNTGALIPLAGPQLAGYLPYTYSDFTGSLQAIVNDQQGFWTAISDAGSSLMSWDMVSWNETSPPGTSVEVEYRVANSLGALPTTTWVPIASPGPIPPTPGQYMEVRVRLVRENDCGGAFITPQVHDVTVSAVCGGCVFGPCEPIVVVCDMPGGAVVDFPDPVWSDPALCEGATTTCDPPSGSVFPVGTTTVTCTTVSALGDTTICQFPVVVTGDCDRVTGGCCLDQDCSTATEAECDAIGGIYLGDGSDCEDGCQFTCVRPPRSMQAWFPLDDAPGGSTENLAEPSVPGVQGGTPTNLPGQWVTASYRFDRSDAADEFVAGDHPTLDLNISDFTIDAWVRTSNFQGVNNILDKRQDSPVRGYRLSLVNGYPSLELVVSGASQTFSLGPADGPAAYMATGQWRMLAVTVDRNIPIGVQFYVDGVPVGSAMNPTSVTGNANSNADLVMGRSHAIGGAVVEWFEGDLDEVEIFRRKLSSTEILELFRAGPSGKCREACYVPDKIVACSNNTATTTITVCNYDDVPHLYSWGISPSSAGCSVAVTSASPAFGSITVGPGDCVSVPITIQVPSTMPSGGTACFNVSVLNHDTGRYFGCTGEIRKNKWWCIKWKKDQYQLHGFTTINPQFPLTAVIGIQHIGPITPGTVLTAQVKAVSYEDETILSDNLGLNGRGPGQPATLQIPIPDDGSETEVQLFVEAFGQQYLNADKLVFEADDDMDGQPEPIAELVLHTTERIPTSVPEETPAYEGKSFRMVPNPFNPRTNIQFELPGSVAMPVDLRIFDLRGRKVKTIYSMEVLAPGLHTAVWDGADKRGNRVASGVYLVQLVTPEFTETVKAVLVK